MQTLREIGPTVGFLAAILVFGHLCAEAGVFAYLGASRPRGQRGRRAPAARAGRGAGRAGHRDPHPRRDGRAAHPGRAHHGRPAARPARPHAYACTRLANSGSLLLPVSNLTNLLAFGPSGLSFGRFAALMALPWLLVCVAEWLGLRLSSGAICAPADADRPAPDARGPRLRADGAGGDRRAVRDRVHRCDVAPAWAAIIGCMALLGAARRAGATVHAVRQLVVEASPGFCLFVLALAVVVDGVTRHGLGDGARPPDPVRRPSRRRCSASPPSAAVLANVVNNLPATLALMPLVRAGNRLVLAVLVGVNIGPNATYPGSLATLLWRRLLPAERQAGRAAEFHALGAITVPLLLVLATAALWLGVRTVGASGAGTGG